MSIRRPLYHRLVYEYMRRPGRFIVHTILMSTPSGSGSAWSGGVCNVQTRTIQRASLNAYICRRLFSFGWIVRSEVQTPLDSVFILALRDGHFSLRGSTMLSCQSQNSAVFILFEQFFLRPTGPENPLFYPSPFGWFSGVLLEDTQMAEYIIRVGE